MAEKINVVNLSKTGRKFILKDGRALLAGASLPVDADEAAHLLGKGASGKPRYPDLLDAAKFSPNAEAAKAAKAAEAEAAKLLKENEELRAKLAEAEKKAAAPKDKKEKGDK